MKKNILWACCLFTSLFFASCSEDYEDASSKHQYGENEFVYLRTDASASTKKNIEFQAGDKEPVVIDLSKYETMFQNEMGMSISQVVDGLSSNEVVMKLINPTKGYWDNSAYTCTNGWYINASSKACVQADAKASLVFDATSKTLKLFLAEGTEAGTDLDINVGFALNGPNYDKYVRIELVVAVTDPSIIMMNVDMEADDYTGYDLLLSDYEENFQLCMGMSAKEVSDGFFAASKTVNFYMSDLAGTWDTSSGYTADAGPESYGFWLNAESKVCNWGDAGYSVFVNFYQADEDIYLGRAPGISAGEQRKVSFVLSRVDDSTKFVRFIFTCNM